MGQPSRYCTPGEDEPIACADDFLQSEAVIGRPVRRRGVLFGDLLVDLVGPFGVLGELLFMRNPGWAEGAASVSLCLIFVDLLVDVGDPCPDFLIGVGARVGAALVVANGHGAGVHYLNRATVPFVHLRLERGVRAHGRQGGPMCRGVVDRERVTVGFWGTSLTEHREAVSSRLIDPARLPQLGEAVVIDDVVCRGYVHRVSLALRVRHLDKDFQFFNHGEGGATSRTVLAIVERTAIGEFDVAVVEMGTNDALRGAQRRVAEAVSVPEFAANYARILKRLRDQANTLLCLGTPPLGWAPNGEDLDVAGLNREIVRYNEAAAEAAAEAGALFVDVAPAFVRTAELLGGWTSSSPRPVTDNLWSDGLHPSELGVELLSALLLDAWP